MLLPNRIGFSSAPVNFRAPLGMVTRACHWFPVWREDRFNRTMQLTRRWFETEMTRGLKFEAR